MNRIWLIGFASLLICLANCECEQFKDFISFEPGDGSINLIITSPHNGPLKPACIKDRSAGCYTKGKCVYSHDCGVKSFSRCKVMASADLGTKEIATNLRDMIVEKFGVRPHLIVNELHRTKLDANRLKDQATFGDTYSEWAFDLYQQNVETAIMNFGPQKKGLLIDVHGVAGHDMKWIEIGYLLKKYQMNNDDLDYKDSSVSNMYKILKNDQKSFENYLRGAKSIGGRLQSLGYKSIPSPAHPKPLNEDYFTGGETLREYGSFGSNVDAIQIESPSHLRSSANSTAYSRDLADVIMAFYNDIYS